MYRREFINNSLITGAGIVLSKNTNLYNGLKTKRRKPVFKKGDTVGLICPGSAIEAKQLQLAKMQLKSYGLKPFYDKNILRKSGYLAGSDKERADELNAMFANKKVKSIWAIRGGYGTGRLLPLLDMDVIKKNKKPIIGYSDLTVLINYLYQKTGTVNYHFTMPGALFTGFGEKQVLGYMFDNKNKIYPLDEPLVCQNKLKATGHLMGGNLTVLCSLVGTPYEINFDGSILFLEDVGEKPYRIDRMLEQMKQAGAFNKIKGLIIGRYEDCEGDLRTGMNSIEDLVASFFAGLDIPVLSNAPIGHIESQWALPIGAKVALDLGNKKLEIID